MVEYTVARRYSVALFQSCDNVETAERCLADIGWINKLIYENSQLKRVVFHPLISRSVKKSIFLELVQKQGLQGLTERFLSLLIERGRIQVIDKIFVFFQELVAESKKQSQVSLRFAFPLGEKRESELKERVKSTLGLKNVEFTVDYDKTLLAGMVISLGDQVIDASMSGKIKILRQQMSE